MIIHTLAVVVFYVCWKKVEAVKEDGIRAWGKQFCVLAPRRVDLSHFYWLVSKRESYQRTHCAMIILYRRLSLVSRPWQPPSLNLSHCTTQDHRLGAMITEITTIVSWWQSFVWDSRKSCSVFRALGQAAGEIVFNTGFHQMTKWEDRFQSAIIPSMKGSFTTLCLSYFGAESNKATIVLLKQPTSNNK